MQTYGQFIFYKQTFSIDSDEDDGSYWFQVTVDDLLPVQHLQAPEKCVGKPTNQSETEALKVILFDELVQVNPVRMDKTRQD